LIASVLLAFVVAADTAPRAISLSDALRWTSIGATHLSPDGAWIAWRVTPTEGDGEVVVRNVKDGKDQKFPAGEMSGGPGGGGGGPFGMAAPSEDLIFSEDGKWLVFKTYAARAEARKAKKERRPTYDKAILLELATGKKTEFEKVRRMAFSGKKPAWLAIHRPGAADSAPPSPAAPPTPMPAPATPAGSAASTRPTGSDLLLVELATLSEMNIGNAAEFAFDKEGRYLAWVVDAADKAGNGVQLRNLATGAVTVLDSGKANYRSLRWNDQGEALAVLKGVEERGFEDKLHAVIGWTGFTSSQLQKTVYDPKDDKSFPAGFTVSPNRAPAWTDDLAALVFGVHEPKKKKEEDKKGEGKKGEERKEEAKAAPKKQEDEPDKADLVLWHWQDKRLPSMQQVQEPMDRNFSFTSLYRVAEKKFLRLADESLRDVSVPEPHKFALGYDNRDYERMGNLDGRRYRDVYTVDVATGERKPALKKYRWQVTPSPDGTHFLYYEDGHWLTYEVATGKSYKLTDKVPAAFWDPEDDHNVVKPPAGSLGWSKDGQFVLVHDDWDVYKIPVHGGAAVNLTISGKKDGMRYRTAIILDREQKGFDLAQPLWINAFSEKSKRWGVAKIESGKTGAELIIWEDAAIRGLQKAKNADVWSYRRTTPTEPSEVFVTSGPLKAGGKVSDQAAQTKQFLMSSGVRLLDYTSAKGDKLQASLFLPASYEAGKKYPMVVYIYERLTQGHFDFQTPGLGAFNRTAYTSNGYAVLQPDIKYRVNDPGMSAVWCVVPAVEAAIAAGVADPARVGIHGHSWGGYQTAFLVTQTDKFRAAIAGAPLTDMISMYSSVYWNSGSANQPIFESSQGRFTGGYWEVPDAYIRNSPVYHASKVKTPLLILHNDKDGAVDFTQGVEYFNTLRRLNKPVVMLQYKGENHGLRQPGNMKDYQVRMKEFFDHHLMGKPAPAWLNEGVPHLKMKDYLDDRAKEIVKPAAPPVPSAPSGN
jgi:dipeptidyl aminopeptidase/acylaminoacyl peptidase